LFKLDLDSILLFPQPEIFCTTSLPETLVVDKCVNLCVSVWVHKHECVHMCVWAYENMWVCECLWVNVCVWPSVCVWVLNVCLCACVCMHVWVCARASVSVCTSVCVSVHMYVHMTLSRGTAKCPPRTGQLSITSIIHTQMPKVQQLRRLGFDLDTRNLFRVTVRKGCPCLFYCCQGTHTRSIFIQFVIKNVSTFTLE
jgi:hypothetical protein